MPNAALSAAYFAALLRQDWRCYAAQLPRCATVKTDTAAVAAETPLLPRSCQEWHCRCRGRNCRVALPRLALPLTRQKLPRCTAAGAAETPPLPRCALAKNGIAAGAAKTAALHCRWRGRKPPLPRSALAKNGTHAVRRCRGRKRGKTSHLTPFGVGSAFAKTGTAADAAENAALCHAKDGFTAPVAALRTRQEWHGTPSPPPRQEWHSRRAAALRQEWHVTPSPAPLRGTASSGAG